ncbi:MAG: ATP-binding protein [Caldisericaceae bacterium]
MYKKRWVVHRLKDSLDVANVLILTGARQTGKTTLLKNESIFKDYKYFTLDDFDVLAQINKDPFEIILSSGKVIIDEAQKSPAVMVAIKKTVDENANAKFVLSGSANLLLMKSVSESLAGRATYNTLYPFALSEWEERPLPFWFIKMFDGTFPAEQVLGNSCDLEKLLFRGFMPKLFEISSDEKTVLWWESYVRTYLERDLRDLSNISSLPDFKKVMELLALRTGSLVDQTGISNDTGISQPTVYRYINLLEESLLFTRLRPHTANKSKSVTKTPKGYYVDSGLAAFLAGARESSALSDKFLGHLFESMILLYLLSFSEVFHTNLSFFRKRIGDIEVDFIAELGNKAIGIEVKMSDKVSFNDARGLIALKEYLPQMVAGVVIYAGDSIVRIAKDVIAVPWKYF